MNKFFKYFVDYKSTNKPFAIVVDDSTKNKLFIKALKDKVKTLKIKEASYYFRDKSIANLSFGDVIFFNTDKEFDFIVETNIDEIEDYSVSNNYFLVDDFQKIIRKLETSFPKKKLPPKNKYDLDIEIEIELPRRKRPIPKRKKYSKVFDVVEINDNFVKIGYDMYPRYIDTLGNDFIIVDDVVKNIVVEDGINILI